LKVNCNIKIVIETLYSRFTGTMLAPFAPDAERDQC